MKLLTWLRSWWTRRTCNAYGEDSPCERWYGHPGQHRSQEIRKWE